MIGSEGSWTKKEIQEGSKLPFQTWTSYIYEDAIKLSQTLKVLP